MPLMDLWGLLIEALRTQRLRSLLTILGIVVGMASVVLLSSIGEGTREGIAEQFSQFGTTIVGVQPGRTKTLGFSVGGLAGTTHPLTVEDVEALRRIPGVVHAAGHVVGMGKVEADGRSRNTYLYGSTSEESAILQWPPRTGSFLPPGDPDRMPPVCVLGSKTASELFPGRSPLGERVRVGEARFTVIGVMSSKGQVLGIDLDDLVYIPIRRAMRMLNRDSVTEIHLLVASHDRIQGVMEQIRRILMDRHNGEEDFTLTSQADMLETVGQVMNVLTAGVLVIAGISLFVGAIGILTIMWVAVHERTWEIGVMKAIGGGDRQVLLVFLGEAAALSGLGGLIGLVTGVAAGAVLPGLVPALRIEIPVWIVPASLLTSIGVGLAAGILPALHAARLDPVEALRAE